MTAVQEARGSTAAVQPWRFRVSASPLVAVAGLVLAAVVLLCAAAPVLPLADRSHQNLQSTLASWTWDHPLGTDQLGRDLLSRLVWGTRNTLYGGFVAVAVATAVGVPIGLVGGYRRGRVDRYLGHLLNALLAVPGVAMVLAAQAAFQADIEVSMGIMGLLFAPVLSRVVRAETIRVSTLPYVQAGRMAGCSHARILRRYLVPNIRHQLLVQLSFLCGVALMFEAGLGFLGVGVAPPEPSLGNLLAGGATMLGRAPRLVILPGLVLSLLVVIFNVAGDRLANVPPERDARP